MLRRTGAGDKSVKSVLKKGRVSVWWKGFCKKIGIKLRVEERRIERVMDDQSQNYQRHMH